MHLEPVGVEKVLLYNLIVMLEKDEKKIIKEVTEAEYKYGFVSNFDTDTINPGLNENIIKTISEKKKEPEWMLKKRLEAFEILKTLKQPDWANIEYSNIDLQNIIYYSAPKKKVKLNSLDEADPELLKTLTRLGISIEEQKRLVGVAVDVVIDSVSENICYNSTKIILITLSFCPRIWNKI